MKIKIFSLLVLLLSFLNAFGQSKQEALLIQSYLDLNSEEAKDELANYFTIKKFSDCLKYILEHDDIETYKNFKLVIDSLSDSYITKEDEKSGLRLFTLRHGFDHWNYILKDNKVIYHEEKTFDYFYNVHQLPDDNYVLIKRMDEMSFSCYEALFCDKNLVYGQNSKFKMMGSKILSVCSWTNVDNSRPGERDPETGLYTVVGGMEYLKPYEIQFDAKTNTIYYFFYRQKDGKRIKREAKYKDYGFKIKSYDARTFEE